MFEFERRPSMPEEPASKRVHIVNPKDDLENVQPSGLSTTTTTRASAFGPSAQRQKSYQEEAAVPPELRSKLESVGMRTRFNVNRGYGSPPPSCSTNVNLNALTSRSGLVTENDVLHAVKSNRKEWQRTQSAPLYVNELQPFGGMSVRPTLLEDSSVLNRSNGNSEQGEDVDPLAAHFFDDEPQEDDAMIDGSISGQSGTSDLKRTRDTFTQEDEQEQTFSAAQFPDPKQFRQLPTASPFGLTRANGATTLPVSAGLTQYLANGSILPQNGNSSADAPWSKQDFSAFTGKEDF
ncbi:uncharacterized protein FA14DRAFT_70375 [Meira miltonrushii]|uniref:Uncharacterized protein n=1 Tax=Meira miltonrushii TaxID=1280837 RepID=A0A316VAF1_9BASI|nr:uncharacterized protein FA14DRAFT_70375 [Meira miltonrushii]PWN34224.1 hypothetical protein FA14DRAFT_70375 [Meira miltonrushii]